MKSLIILLSFSAICMANLVPNTDPINPEDNDYISSQLEENGGLQSRIMGGEVPGPTAFPYKVGLELYLVGKVNWCGGSLISNRYVLTAAHCLQDVMYLFALIGDYERTDTGEEGRLVFAVWSTNFIIHKEFITETLSNDIALIKLPKDVEFTDKIQPITLPSYKDENTTFEGTEAVASGWGYYDSTHMVSRFIRFVNVRVVGNILCEIFFGMNMKESNICVDGSTRKGVCNGDSGGPLTTNNADGKSMLIGFTSFGSVQACDIGWPTVFTRVTSHLKWISENAGINIA